MSENPSIQPSSFKLFAGWKKLWFQTVRLLGFPFLAFSILYWIYSLSEFPLFKWKRQLVHFHSLFGYINSRNGNRTNEWTLSQKHREKNVWLNLCAKCVYINIYRALKCSIKINTVVHRNPAHLSTSHFFFSSFRSHLRVWTYAYFSGWNCSQWQVFLCGAAHFPAHIYFNERQRKKTSGWN